VTAGGVAANLGGVALFALPGLGLAEILGLARRLSWPHRLAYAYLLGVPAAAGALFAASHLAGVPLRRPAIVAAVVAPAILGLAAWIMRRRRGAAAARGRHAPGTGQMDLDAPAAEHRDAAATERRDAGSAPASGRRDGGSAPAGRRRWRWVVALAITAGAAVVAVVLGPLVSALISPLADWDGRMTWVPLGAHLRHEGTVDAEVLRDPRWFEMHPRYPPLLPLAQAIVQEALGAGDDDQFYRGLYVAFLAALLLVVHDGARRAAGRLPAAATVLSVATIPFLSYGAGGATSAYSDMPLAALYGGALVLLLTRRATAAAGLAAGILLGGAILAKNEGGLLAAAALLVAASRLFAPGGRRLLLLWFGAAALPALAAAALLASWRAAIPNRDDEGYFAALNLATLAHGAVTRLPWIAGQALRLAFDGSWLGFWLAFAAVLLAGRRELRQPVAWRLLLAGLAPPAVGFAAYAVSSRLPALLPETWHRFLLQALVPLAVTFACALGGVLRQLRPR
jgi:hypothetical protein